MRTSPLCASVVLLLGLAVGCTSETSVGEPDDGVCGNGEVEAGEACDDGNTETEECAYDQASCQICDADCRLVAGGGVTFCGDGIVDNDNDELCDDGNDVTESCPYGFPSCEVCTASCERGPGVTSFCGDGDIDGANGETCDDGNATTEACPYGEASCTVCDESCQETPGPTSFCGDGLVDATNGEECDDGNTVDGDACNDDCTSPLIDVVTGFSHTCALRGGEVFCWGGDGGEGSDGGEGGFAALGYGNPDDIGDDETPRAYYAGLEGKGAVALGKKALGIAGGALHNCVITTEAKVRCWGGGDGGEGYGPSFYGFPFYGTLGYDDPQAVGDDETPAAFYADQVGQGDVSLGSDDPVVALAAGLSHTCALFEEGNVRCWGTSLFTSGAELGYGVGSMPSGRRPSRFYDDELDGDGDVDFGSSAIAVAAGAFHTCVLLTTGAVRCWGDNNEGQLGYDNGYSRVGDFETPAQAYLDGESYPDEGDVDFGEGTAVQIAAGWLHTCVLLDTGKVRCWGLNRYGQLGYGSTDYSVGGNQTPAQFYESLETNGDIDLGPGATATAIAAGAEHTCALLDTGKVRCWGRHQPYGSLGYGDIGASSIGFGNTPGELYEAAELPDGGDLSIPPTLGRVKSGMSFHTCVVSETNVLGCFGNGSRGQLGQGTRENIGDDELPDSVPPVDF